MSRFAARSALALLITFLALAGMLLGGATPAYAHAILVRTDPPDGAVLDEIIVEHGTGGPR